jgi:hypothetical protein
MNKTTKGIITVAVTASVVYVVYMLIQKRPLFVGFKKQRDFIWDELVRDVPAMAKLKDVYFKTDAYNDRGYIAAWYTAKKKGENTFKYKGRAYNTKDGIGI